MAKLQARRWLSRALSSSLAVCWPGAENARDKCCGAGLAAIDRYILPAGITAANPPHAAAAVEWDRRTVRRTDGYRTVGIYYADSANN